MLWRFESCLLYFPTCRDEDVQRHSQLDRVGDFLLSCLPILCVKGRTTKGGNVICHLDIGYESTVQKFFLDFLLGMCGWPFISATDSTDQNEPTLHRKCWGRKSYFVADVYCVFRPRMVASVLNTCADFSCCYSLNSTM